MHARVLGEVALGQLGDSRFFPPPRPLAGRVIPVGHVGERRSGEPSGFVGRQLANWAEN
jgi:hypothetical protein